MHSSLLYSFCCRDKADCALIILNSFDDIDIMYNDGDIIRVMISKNQATLLRAALDYFENKQFPIKDDGYKEKSQKLIETLEEFSDGSNAEISRLVSEYIGNDVAILQDVNDLPMNSPVQQHIPLISASVSKLSNIELCIEAAKIGNVSIIREHLDVENPSHKIAVVSAAIHNLQEAVIDVVMDMVEGNKKKATVLRMAGDIFTQADLFQKAEEYYNKSLEMHPNYYVTYSKMGALYQCWSAKGSVDDTAQKLMLGKAIESYDKALEFQPKHIKRTEVQERLDIVASQLEHLRLVQDSEDTASVGCEDDAITEILLYVSEEDGSESNESDNISLCGTQDCSLENAPDFL